MGQAISKIYSVGAREVKMYNIEKRAENIISQEKPTPAPLHPSTKKELKRLNKEHVTMDYLLKKDDQLDDYLKKVYVTTPDPAPPTKIIHNPGRPLPQNRHYDRDISYGYSEAEEVIVPEGKVTLRQALEFLKDHQTDPKTHTNATIAAQYKLPITTTDDILEHFKIFNVHLLKKGDDQDKLSSYGKLLLKVKNMSMHDAPGIVKEIKKVMEKADITNTTVEEVKNKSDKNIKTNEDNNSNIKGGGENR